MLFFSIILLVDKFYPRRNVLLKPSHSWQNYHSLNPLAGFYPSIDGFSFCWSCKLFLGWVSTSLRDMSDYGDVWAPFFDVIGRATAFLCVSSCRCCVSFSFACSPLNPNLNSKSWLQMIEFESLLINKKMGLNIFGFKLKNYKFHQKNVLTKHHTMFFFNQRLYYIILYIYIYISVCVFVFFGWLLCSPVSTSVLDVSERLSRVTLNATLKCVPWCWRSKYACAPWQIDTRCAGV